MDNIGLQPPIIPPPPTPPSSPPPPVVPEEPIIQKPVNPTGKKIKKNLPKLAVGALVMVLLVGGLVLGKNLLLQQQRPVEKLAAGTCSGSWTCTCPSDAPASKCNQPGKSYTYYCSIYNTDEATCTGGGNGQGNFCTYDWDFSGGCSWSSGASPSPSGVCVRDPSQPNSCYKPTNQSNVCTQPGYTYGCGMECCTTTLSVVCCCTGCYPGGTDCNLHTCASPSPSPSVSPSPSPSVSPSPSPSPTVACVDLTKNVAAPKLHDQVTFTCEAAFSAVSPVAFFRYSSDNGTTYSSALPSGGAAINPTTKKASYAITVDKNGSWIVQCKVCTNSSATTCTQWGKAN